MSNSLERQRFEAAFAKRLGKTPAEFVQQKLHSGSKVADVRYQYEITAGEIARQSGCRKQNFSLYYPPNAPLRPERPENQESPPVTVQKKHFHKLVRDRIPEIIEADGKACVWETLSDEDYLRLLDKKLNEELAEYQQSKSLEELADLLEVLGAVVTARGYTWNQLTALRKEKREQRGGFEKRILLKEVQSKSDSAEQKRPQNAGKPWTKEEENRLVRNFRNGNAISELARQHQRTENAIRIRLEQLGEIEPGTK